MIVKEKMTFLSTGSRFGGEVHLSDSVPDDKSIRGQVQNRRHEGPHIRENFEESRDGPSGRRLGHSQSLSRQARSLSLSHV